MNPSSHKVEVVPVKLEPHPNADSLSIVNVYGFTVCVRTEDWRERELGAYIQPDSIVPNNEQFAFLNGHNRIKVKRLRGVVSMGILVPAPEGSNIGDDVAEVLGVKHYEPPIKGEAGTPRGESLEAESPPVGVYAPKYDVENMLRYYYLFEEGEYVFVTEKIHGANARFVYHDGRMWCGSKNEWKKESEGNLWWKSLKQNQWLQNYCLKYPGDIVYAEVFGNVQSLKYGCPPDQFKVAVFDVLRKGDWLPISELQEYELSLVPSLGAHPFSLEKLKELAEGNSLVNGANHIREGIVVKPLIERRTKTGERLQLKLISNAYLEQN